MLLKEIGYDTETTFRDVDIVRVSDGEVDLEVEEQLSAELMQDDHQHGHGIGQIEQDYFDTRDFTINELLFCDGKLFFTADCLRDTVLGIIRFSDYEVKQSDDEEAPLKINDKLLAKAIRFAAELTLRGLRSEIHNKEVYRFINIQHFHIALHLDRALEVGYKVAAEYVKKLIELEVIQPDLDTPKKLQEYLHDVLYDEGFVFRFSAG